MARKMVPTDDPCCPPQVRCAKSIRHAITERTDLVVGEDTNDIANDAFDHFHSEIESINEAEEAATTASNDTLTIASYPHLNFACKSEQS